MSRALGRAEYERLIDEWILGNRAERNREILKARLLMGRTIERIAEDFGLSVTQVKRIIYKGTETIAIHTEVKKVGEHDASGAEPPAGDGER